MTRLKSQNSPDAMLVPAAAPTIAKNKKGGKPKREFIKFSLLLKKPTEANAKTDASTPPKNTIALFAKARPQGGNFDNSYFGPKAPITMSSSDWV